MIMEEPKLSSEEKRRYSRQIAIGEIGVEGQMRLKDAKIFIVGCGALGSMSAMQLAGAGIGNIGISDFDKIDESNLQRQFFFKSSEAGKSKAEVLHDRMTELNSSCNIEVFNSLVNKDMALKLFMGYDYILDATDNPASKHMIESVCEELDKPCCIGGVSGFRGQVMTVLPGSHKFRDLFPDTDDGGFLPCSIGGVVGPAAAICASIQVSEVIKQITGAGECLVSKVITFDLLENRFSTLTF